MIAFGRNSFKLTSFKPSKVSLPAEMDEDTTIVRTQKCFHFLWIPCFPIEQVWTLKKKGDSNSYDVSPGLNQFLNAMPLKYTTPWYTFVLPIYTFALPIIGSTILIIALIWS